MVRPRVPPTPRLISEPTPPLGARSGSAIGCLTFECRTLRCVFESILVGKMRSLSAVALECRVRFAGKSGVDTGDAPVTAQVDGCGIRSEVRDLWRPWLHARKCVGIEDGI